MIHIEKEASKLKLEDPNWRQSLDLSLQTSDAEKVILNDSKLGIERSQPLIIDGTFDEMIGLVVSVICKDRLGAISSFADAVAKRDCTIIKCQGDLLMPSLQSVKSVEASGGKELTLDQEVRRGLIETQRSLRLHHSSFQIIGNVENLKLLWDDLATLNDVPSYPFIERQGKYHPVILEGCGPDSRGILHSVFKVLYERRINVQYFMSSVHLTLEKAKDSAVLKLKLEVPVDCDMDIESMEKLIESDLPLGWQIELHSNQLI